ncbi:MULTISPECIES: hypothetical protein [unclassified Streptomyces]|uniref:hypothetical protein n=1 Tax=unclassified Streptomyces TaxID=2593676 RepID=UPI0036356C98
MTLPNPFHPEDLLDLGAAYTRLHDSLIRLNLPPGPASAKEVVENLLTSQALARRTLDAGTAVHTAPRLRHSPEVRAAVDRMSQLATLTVIAADHLIAAADLLYPDAGASPDRHQAEGLLDPDRAGALTHIRRAKEMTSLGAEDCLTTAGLLAREMHEQNRGPLVQPPRLSSAQHSALLAVAAGRVSLYQGKVTVARGRERISITTIRTLENRNLLHREPCVLWMHDERPHLSPEGRRAVAAVLSRPRSPAPMARRPTARPAADRSVMVR